MVLTKKPYSSGEGGQGEGGGLRRRCEQEDEGASEDGGGHDKGATAFVTRGCGSKRRGRRCPTPSLSRDGAAIVHLERGPATGVNARRVYCGGAQRLRTARRRWVAKACCTMTSRYKPELVKFIHVYYKHNVENSINSVFTVEFLRQTIVFWRYAPTQTVIFFL
ncbi:hypothetical protein PF011_g24127 [Phytophthora fragariae]|uniref:Uncharacterized protein n=1 Tax=Phytophthora fragariae TaxID=53985 RepID=A0A6A3I8C2_9STRA|nr:hypothetical protein PF011_g24127 [Phytophthora fragariae]